MTQNEWIYWGYDTQLKRQNNLLETENHHPRSRELIRAYQTYLLTNSVKQPRVAKLTWGLRRVSLELGKPLDQATKTDMERVLPTILTEKSPNTGKGLSENTQRDYKRCVKQFYRWLADQDDLDAPETLPKLCEYLRKHVKTPDPKRNHDPGNCLTDEDVSLVLDKGCVSHMERAFISTLFESGTRIGEHLALRIADIEEGQDLWAFRAMGKTGERTVPIIQSIPFITRWLAFHPDRNNPDAPLWVITHNGRYGQPLRYIGARRLIERCFKRAGVKKRHNPHWWRHSRATIDARDPNYTDSVLCQKMGHGPKVAARYRHMSAQDVKDAARRSAGIKVAEDSKRRPLLPQQCRGCLEVNTHDAKYCCKCGKPLRIEVVQEEQRVTQELLAFLPRLLTDPSFRERYEKALLAEKGVSR